MCLSTMDYFGSFYVFMHGIQETNPRQKTLRQSHVLFGSQTAIVGLTRMDEYSFGWLARL